MSVGGDTLTGVAMLAQVRPVQRVCMLVLLPVRSPPPPPASSDLAPRLLLQGMGTGTNGGRPLSLDLMWQVLQRGQEISKRTW